MEGFLKKIKLIDDFSIVIPIGKTEFADKLSNIILPQTTLIESFGNSDKLFIGKVDFDAFSIRPKKKLPQNNYVHMAKLEAIYNGNQQKTTIEGRISLTKTYPLIMISAVVLYFIITLNVMKNSEGLSMFLPLIVQLVFMIGVFYFMFRKTIKSAKDFFEKELFDLAK